MGSLQCPVRSLYGDAPPVRFTPRPAARISRWSRRCSPFFVLACLAFGLVFAADGAATFYAAADGPVAIAGVVLLYIAVLGAFVSAGGHGCAHVRKAPGRILELLDSSRLSARLGHFPRATITPSPWRCTKLKIFFTTAFTCLSSRRVFPLHVSFPAPKLAARLWGARLLALMLSARCIILRCSLWIPAFPAFFASVHFLQCAYFGEPAFPFESALKEQAFFCSWPPPPVLLPQYSMLWKNFRIFDFRNCPITKFLSECRGGFLPSRWRRGGSLALRIEARRLVFLVPASLLPFAAWVWVGI